MHARSLCQDDRGFSRASFSRGCAAGGREAAAAPPSEAEQPREKACSRKAGTVFARQVDRGFTLIEVMVAMAILVVGMTTILGLLSFGLALHRTSAERADCARAVESVLAELRREAFLSKDPKVGAAQDPPSTIESRPVPGEPEERGLTYSAKLREHPKIAGEYLAEIEIEWKEKGRRRSQIFRTILLQEIPFSERVKRLPGKGSS